LKRNNFLRDPRVAGGGIFQIIEKEKPMERQIIAVEKFLLKVHTLWSKQWLLLTSGDFTAHHFNSMTVGWGGFGTMWSKPFVQIVVRPTRYTFEFMEQYDTFTLCAFPPAYQKALQLTGSKSGRDGDKIKATGLTPIPASRIAPLDLLRRS
jgi:hypothetical protein